MGSSPPPLASAPVAKPKPPVVAVVGATGDLGRRLASAFLSPELRDRTSAFVSLARRHSGLTQRWESMGAEIRVVEDDFDENDLVMALDGVDVLVNALSAPAADLRDLIARTLPKTGVKLYFPSEFGVDHTLHDFAVPEWDGKKKHYDLVRRVVRDTDIQVCRLFVGLFVHSGIAPWYGFHTAKGVYRVVGTVDQSISLTEIADIAKVICVLAERVAAGDRIPTSLRIAGTHASIRQIADIMAEAGAGEIELKSLDLEAFRDKELRKPYEHRGPIVCLRFLMGDGRIDYRPQDEGGLGNDNDIVNPGEKDFVWKTIKDLAAETKGKPNAHA